MRRRQRIETQTLIHAPARNVLVFQTVHVSKNLIRAGAVAVHRTCQKPRRAQSHESEPPDGSAIAGRGVVWYSGSSLEGFDGGTGGHVGGVGGCEAEGTGWCYVDSLTARDDGILMEGHQMVVFTQGRQANRGDKRKLHIPTLLRARLHLRLLRRQSAVSRLREGTLD